MLRVCIVCVTISNVDHQIIKDLVTLFPVIRDWIAEFLFDHKDMTATEVGCNMLISQVFGDRSST